MIKNYKCWSCEKEREVKTNLLSGDVFFDCEFCQSRNIIKQTVWGRLAYSFIGIILAFIFLAGYIAYDRAFNDQNRSSYSLDGFTNKDIIGEYYWDPGLGYEVKVIINEDGTWRKDVWSNGKKSSTFNGEYKIITKSIKKMDDGYDCRIITFDDSVTGYQYKDHTFIGIDDEIYSQSGIITGDDPFPGVLNDGCKYTRTKEF